MKKGAARMYNSTSNWSTLKLIRYSLLVFLLIFFLLECIFRFIFFFSNTGLHTTLHIQGSPLKTPDAVLIWKNRPFYVDYDHAFQYNEEGMKSEVGDIFIPVKNKDDFWVLLTGASAMEGMGSNKNGEWIDITGIQDYPYRETIACYLEKILQAQMPGKKIKVFNAASSGYNIYQSFCRYLLLSKKMNVDWVVSMDGCNEPARLRENESVFNLAKEDWDKSPQFHFPLNGIVALTSHSALINAIKQKLFHVKQNLRLEGNKQKNYPAMHKWLNAQVPPVMFAGVDQEILRAVDSFTHTINRYDSTLTADGKKHLLLIQPYMCLRDTLQLNEREKAVNHYYRSAYNNSPENSFMRVLHQAYAVKTDTLKRIVSMDAVHRWKENVFVDYCHFTNAANQKIAAEIGRYILSNGTSAVFTK